MVSEKVYNSNYSLPITDMFHNQFSTKQETSLKEIVSVAPWLLDKGVSFRDAIITVDRDTESIIWHDGIWRSGFWDSGEWRGGWVNGEYIYCSPYLCL